MKESSLRTHRIIQAAIAIVFAIVHLATIHEFYKGSMTALTSFTAYRPFQFRVLVPAIVHVLEYLAPLPLVVWYTLFTALSVFLILVYFERLLPLLAPELSSGWRYFILLPLTINTILITRYYYPSDLLSVALFELGLLLILERRWWPLIAVCCVGAFNRDLIALLIPATIALRWEDLKRPSEHRATLLALAGQEIVFVAIRSLLQWIFRQNPGENFEDHVEENLFFFTLLSQGGWKELIYFFGTFGGLQWLALVRYRTLPSVLQRLLLLFPLVLGIMFVVGRYREIRVFNEMIPLFALSGAVILDQLLARRPVRARVTA